MKRDAFFDRRPFLAKTSSISLIFGQRSSSVGANIMPDGAISLPRDLAGQRRVFVWNIALFPSGALWVTRVVSTTVVDEIENHIAEPRVIVAVCHANSEQGTEKSAKF